MSRLHYQIFFQGTNSPGMDVGDYARTLVSSGSIPVTDSMSAAVDVPEVPYTIQAIAIAVFKVLGPDAVYVQFAKRGQGAPAGTGAHAVADAFPRMLLDEVDGARTIVLPQQGRFAAVQAAAL
ncbi:hypothetical protein [Methylobacterium planeticum]|uniref:Uncharacterized protein n=1 Tax=Methylobacterium planeticum TaxID=2615211 RepID=A0A6N6MG75_9HYPH|nr:hypothetical protein [Methylobacterium planeticum]KAB1068831.1 hypothetical protein F6X51_26315 [Methylobacterium planeticum]